MKKALLFLSLFLVILSAVQAQNVEDKAEEYMNRYLELGRFSGIVLVTKNQQIIFNEGYGKADYENNVPLENNTKFCLATLTEQFTAYIALKVFEEHAVSLNEPIKDVLKEIKFKHADVALHHLLTHTSGLPDYPLINHLPKIQFFSKENLIAHFDSIMIENKPGEKFSYSKLNYNLVGLLLEDITGKNFDQLLREYIATPRGMKNTSLDNHSALKNKRARGYTRKTYTEGWINAPYIDPSNSFAAQGILSTAEDLLIWNRYIRENYLNDKILQKMLAASSDSLAYGLKVKRNKAGKLSEIQSIGGFTSGFNAFSLINLDSEIDIIVLGNCRHPASGQIAVNLHAISTNEQYELPLPRKVVELKPTDLQKLAGNYKINDQVTVKILAEGNRLFVNDSMHPKFEVFPQSKNQFFMEDIDAEIRFIKNSEGEVTQIALCDDGIVNIYAEKIDK